VSPIVNSIMYIYALDRERIKLQRFLTNVRFVTTHREKNGQISTKPKVLTKITAQSASDYKFEGSDGNETSVAQYFGSLGTNLQYPNFVCIQVRYRRLNL
jgi:eukaryotic translation initiation factor 2C